MNCTMNNNYEYRMHAMMEKDEIKAYSKGK